MTRSDDVEADVELDAEPSDEFTELGLGASVTVLFANEINRPYRLQLVEGESDLINGDVSITSKLGMQLQEAREEDEIQLEWGGCLRTCTVQSIQHAESADV